MAYTLGGHVDTAPVSEYGKTEITTSESKLFENVDKNTVVWMSIRIISINSGRFQDYCLF